MSLYRAYPTVGSYLLLVPSLCCEGRCEGRFFSQNKQTKEQMASLLSSLPMQDQMSISVSHQMFASWSAFDNLQKRDLQSFASSPCHLCQAACSFSFLIFQSQSTWLCHWQMLNKKFFLCVAQEPSETEAFFIRVIWQKLASNCLTGWFLTCLSHGLEKCGFLAEFLFVVVFCQCQALRLGTSPFFPSELGPTENLSLRTRLIPCAVHQIHASPSSKGLEKAGLKLCDHHVVEPTLQMPEGLLKSSQFFVTSSSHWSFWGVKWRKFSLLHHHFQFNNPSTGTNVASNVFFLSKFAIKVCSYHALCWSLDASCRQWNANVIHQGSTFPLEPCDFIHWRRLDAFSHCSPFWRQSLESWSKQSSMQTRERLLKFWIFEQEKWINWQKKHTFAFSRSVNQGKDFDCWHAMFCFSWVEHLTSSGHFLMTTAVF